MSFRVHQVLDIEPLEFAVGEHVINLNDSNSYSNEQTNSLPNAFSHPNVSPWVISEKIWKIIYKFDNDILTQFPCAYLTPTSTHSAPLPWFEASIPVANNWLKQNNPYL
ncbi:18474_t:CDS:2, partial [Gigaspora rosea]